MTPLELVLAVVDCGFVIQLGKDHKPSLIPTKTGATVPPELMDQLRANSYAIRNWILSNTDPVACSVCKRDLTDPEDRERMADPAFCEQGGAPEQRDYKTNIVHVAALPRCPYKRKGK